MSAYVGSGPYTCHICKEEYDIEYVDERFYTVKEPNPEFSTFDMCNTCGAEKAIKSLIKHTKEGRLIHGNFHIVKKLFQLLEDWYDAERKKCVSCQHERNGCQYHDEE